RSLVRAHRSRLLVDPLADAGLDQDPPRGVLDQQAVKGLEDPVIGVDLVRDEIVPEEPRDRAEQGSRIGSERAGLDQRDACPPTEVRQPVDGIVDRHSYGFLSLVPSKSRWNADAVGSFCPLYRERSSGEPYGRSTADDILKNEIWPMRMP